MAAKALPSQEVLRQLLDYDPATGALTWKPRAASNFPKSSKPNATSATWNARFAGRPAGAVGVIGYHVVTIDSKHHYAHHIAWVLADGGGLSGVEIDHINGNRSDNRIENLRAVPKSENAKNKRLSRRNVSGISGVRLFKPNGKWTAEIQANGKRHYLGYFPSFDDAVAARKRAEVLLGFHENHGRSP